MASDTTSHNKPSLAILDDYFDLAPKHFAHLSSQLSKISSYPETINASKDPSALISRLKPYNIIACMRERTAFPRSILSELPNLKLLITTGLRNASIDVKACEDHNITLAGVSGSSRPIKVDGFDNTSEHCWALILTLAKGTSNADHTLKSSAGTTTWQSQLQPSISLAGKTLAILGLGKLGSNIARTAVLGFGMKIICWSQNLTQAKADQQAESRGLPAGTFKCTATKEDLFREADILSIHTVLSDRTRNLVSEPELKLMKSSALLINTSRAPIIHETSLLTCLKSRGIRGVALDVFDPEPLPPDSPWRTTSWGKEHGTSDVVMTPHMAYVEEQMLEAWYGEQAGSLEGWLDRGVEGAGHLITSGNTGYAA